MLLRSVAPVFFFGAMRLPARPFVIFCLYIRSIPPFPLPDARFCLLQANFFAIFCRSAAFFAKMFLTSGRFFSKIIDVSVGSASPGTIEADPMCDHHGGTNLNRFTDSRRKFT